MKRVRAQLGLLPLAVVIATAAYASGFWLALPLGAPTTADFQSIEQTVRDNWQATDAIVIHPWWSGRLYEYFSDLPLLAVADPAAEDFSKFPRIWLINRPGEHPLAEALDNGRLVTITHWNHGGLDLSLIRVPAAEQVVYDFRAHLNEARVAMGSGQHKKACTRWIQDRWQCSNQEWNYVGRVIIALGADPRWVIWAHPIDRGPLEITYPNVPGGESLLIHSGLTPEAARAPENATVTLRLAIDGQVIGRVEQDDRSGYFPHRFDISSYGPGPHSVTFRISAPSRHMRVFCFDAEVRK